MKQDPRLRVIYSAKKEIEELKSFIEYECTTIHDIYEYYKYGNRQLPDEAYIASTFILNKRYEQKKGSLLLLFETARRLENELPPSTKETIIELTIYRYKIYFSVLKKGGFL